MADQIDNRKKYKSGDYVYFAGYGIAKVLGHEDPPPRFDASFLGAATPKTGSGPLDGLSLPGLKKPDETKSIPPFLRQSPDAKPEPKHLRIAVIPEQREHSQHIFYVRFDSPHLMDPFDKETLDRAMEECTKPQEPRFDNIKDLLKEAERLINSHDLVDVGRAYAYTRGHRNPALKEVTQQAIKIFLTHKGYFDFVKRGQTYDANALRRTGKRLKLGKMVDTDDDGAQIEVPVTPLIGQEPVKSAVEEAVQEVTQPAEKPDEKPKTVEERQSEELDKFLEELAGQCDEEQFRQLAFLVAVLNNEKSDHLNFSQRLIILNELFGSKENRPAVVQQIKTLSHSKAGRNFSEAKYKTSARSAFREACNILDNIEENKVPLEVHEAAADHPEAYSRLADRIFAYQ